MQKIFDPKSQIRKLPHIRKVHKSNKFLSPQICGFSEAWGKMIHEKNLRQKILWHCPFKAKHQRTQECTDVTSQKFIKILSLETIPLNSRVNGFLKRNIQEFIFNIEFSHNYLSSLSKEFSPAITVSTKSPPPPMEWRRKSADGCRTTFSLRPNSSESEKAWSSFNL